MFERLKNVKVFFSNEHMNNNLATLHLAGMENVPGKVKSLVTLMITFPPAVCTTPTPFCPNTVCGSFTSAVSYSATYLNEVGSGIFILGFIA